MKNLFKKAIALFLTIACMFMFGACGNKNDGEVNVYIVDGAPTLCMVNIINKGKIDGKKINIKLVSGVAALQTALINGSADLAVMPIDKTQDLYNNGVDVKMLSANIFGSLYIVSKNSLSTLDDLKGKEISVVGQGATPDRTLRFLFEQNDIDYVTEQSSATENNVFINYVANDVIVAKLKTGAIEYALIGEPLVTKAKGQIQGLNTVANIKELWSTATQGKAYTQAGVSVRGDFAKKNKKFINEFYKELENNKQFVLSNLTTLSSVLPTDSALSSISFTEEIVNRCNIGAIKAKDCKEDIQTYLTTLGVTFNEKVILDF